MIGLSQLWWPIPSPNSEPGHDTILASDTEGKSAVGKNERRREDLSGKGLLHLKNSVSQ